MFKTINAALHRKPDLPLPHHEDDQILANDFNRFFCDKIERIRQGFQNVNSNNEITTNIPEVSKLKEFQNISEDKVRKLILKMPTKHCTLDPLPTWLAKDCIDEIIPIITEIINASLKLGIMPNDLKHALVKPLLKKCGLELTMKNYRPVSNLTFLSKLIESIVISQYSEHLTEHNLNDNKQSADRKSVV